MTVVWSADAELDRLEIYEFIHADKPSAANRIDLAVKKTVSLLAAFPEMGRRGRIDGTWEHAIPRTPHLVIYSIERDRLVVLRITHGAQQWPPE